MDFMASNSYVRSASRRPWQKSMDSQEFGFASTFIESMEVAPADELFFKGQLLPLQMDPRLHLVQALSSCEEGPSNEGIDRAGASTLSVWREDEEIKGPWALSFCPKDEEISFNSCRIMEGDIVDVDYRASMGKLTSADLRSLSFRSHNSGFWESGADKDTGDSSSSSRDSNGSSQDSYFPNSAKFTTISSNLAHRHHTKASFSIPWKSLFKRASNKATSSSSSPISRVGCSEDLGKLKECPAPSSSNGAKEAVRPWKLDSVANKQGTGKGIPSSNDMCKSGLKNNSVLCGAAKDDAGAHVSTMTSKTATSKGIEGRGSTDKAEMKSKQGSAAMKERWQGYARRLRPLYEMKKGLMGQFRMDECGKRACEVESGNIYAATTPMQRKLSHQFSLFESHKVIIQEQNRSKAHPHKANSMLAMSSCPPSTRSSPNHSGVLAVIDAKQKSTATTANTAPLQFAHGTKKINTTKDITSNKFGISATHANKNVKGTSNDLPSSNYSSMSTMQELHSALQSAIAHCKESNKRLDCPA